MALSKRLERLVGEAPLAAISPWVALTCIWLLFELPTMFWPGELRPSELRPSGEVLLLLTLGAASYQVRWGRLARVLLYALAATLVLVRIDVLVFRLILGEDPLLFDQVFMLRHALVLIRDLWSVQMVVALLLVCGGCTFLFWLIRRLFRALRPLLSEPRLGHTARVGIGLWACALVLGQSAQMGLTEQPLVRWAMGPLLHNIEASLATHRALERSLANAPYEELDRISLTQRPDVLLVLIESYGRIMATDPALRRGYHRQLQEMGQTLEKAGFHAVSAYSRAPVTGGRSWIAEGSVLMGSPVRYESVFRHLIDHRAQLRTMVSFFNRQQYRTLLVVPADRKRPGIEDVTNRYGFTDVLHFDRLGYVGKPYGWGLVPDQYTLDLVDERYLRPAQEPLFVDFHLVSSHAPWKRVPELVDDYRALQRDDAREPVPENRRSYNVLLSASRGFTRSDGGRRDYMGELTSELADRYGRSVLYSLAAVSRFLSRREKDALVVLMGDHQPPVISKHTESFDVPVHVLSKDRTRLDELREHGFVDGMRAADASAAPIGHGGLLTLLARTLRRCCGEGPTPKLERFGVAMPR